MSSESQSADGNPNEPGRSEEDATGGPDESQPLSISLPDGSESVSDAIITHREMLIQPSDHGLASESDIEHLSEAVDAVVGDVEDATRESEENQSRIADLETTVQRQREEIEELRAAVTSLAEILGTEIAWETREET